MLDYGYRSKCCFAPIRVARKKIRKTQEIVTVWQCISCMTKDCQILPKDEALLLKKQKEKETTSLIPPVEDDRGFAD